MGMHFATKELL